MTEKTHEAHRERRHSGRSSLPICATSALLVVAFAAQEFSSPARLGHGAGRDIAREALGAASVLADRAGPNDIARMREFAAGHAGYVVWESRRPSGTQELKYRIWK